ncbi:MAG: response regulator [Anaerolineae bacterium]|nr:response regulator [Anaerolineae bacterium]
MQGFGKILAVDDSNQFRLIIETFLSSEGYQVTTCASGEEAIQILEQNNDIDLVLLDVIMPTAMDGFETLKYIRQHPQIGLVKVIMLTSANESSDVIKAFEMGADDYVTKPFHLLELKARAATHIKLKQREEELARANHFMEKVFKLAPTRISIFNMLTKMVEYTNVQDKFYLPGMTLDEYNHIPIEERFRRTVHPEDLDLALKILEIIQQLTDDQIHAAEFRRIEKGNKSHWHRTYFNIFERDSDGKVSKVLAINIDITAQKELELALQKAHNELEERVRERTAELKVSNDELKKEIEKSSLTNAYLQATLNNNLQAFILLDADQKRLVYNRAFEELVQRHLRRGIEDEDSIYDFMSDRARPIFDDCFNKAMTGESNELEAEISWSASVPRWYRFCFTPSRTDDNQVMGVCIAILDITRQKQSEMVFEKERLLLRQHYEENTARLQENNQDLIRQSHARLETLNAALREIGTLAEINRQALSALKNGDPGEINQRQHNIISKIEENENVALRLLDHLLQNFSVKVEKLGNELVQKHNPAGEPEAIESKSSNVAGLLNSNPIILIADDNEISLTRLSKALKSHGCKVIEARNGREVIEKIEEQPVTIVLMDVQMPEMNGLEAIRFLRSSGYLYTPIIALTSNDLPEERQHCLKAGANEYLVKPVDDELLIKTIENLIHLVPEH